MRLSVSLVISRIENFQESFRFEKATAAYLRDVDKIESHSRTPRTIHVLVFFDPGEPKQGHYWIKPFTSRSKTINAEMYVNSNETALLAEPEIIRHLNSCFNSMLERIGEQFPDKEGIVQLQEIVATKASRLCPNLAVRSPKTQDSIEDPTGLDDLGHRLILRVIESDLRDFDSLIQLEEALSENLQEIAQVDGHDIGQGEINLYIYCATPEPTLERMKALLEQSRISRAQVFSQMDSTNEPKLIWESGTF